MNFDRIAAITALALLVVGTLIWFGAVLWPVQAAYLPSSPLTYDEALGIEALIDLGLRDCDVVPAGEPCVDVLYKYGYNSDVGTLAYETVWSQGGFYGGWLDSAVTMSIASTDADDTAAGTGARTVAVYGYDDDLLELDPIVVSLNGQTEVAITLDLRRSLRGIVLTAGSSNGNEGTIYIGSGTFTAGVPTTIYARIDPPLSTEDGDDVNQTLMAVWTCPSDARCVAVSAPTYCSAACDFRMRYRSAGGLWRVILLGSANNGTAQGLANGHRHPLGPGDDWECQVKSTSGGPIEAGCAAAFRIYRNLPEPLPE